MLYNIISYILVPFLFLALDKVLSLLLHINITHSILADWRETTISKWGVLSLAIIISPYSMPIICILLFTFTGISIVEGSFFPNFFNTKPFSKS